MNFLDGHLFPENQDKLVITAAPYGPEWIPSDFPEDIPVTMAEQVLELPLTSVTVRMTVLPLTLAQLNVVMFSAKVATPQASELPLLTWLGVMVALPVLLS